MKRRRLRAFFVVLILLAIAAVGGAHLYWQHEADNTPYPPVKIGTASTIFDTSGSALGHISSAGDRYVALSDEQISPLLRQAHMAAEDRDFYDHGAISPLGMARGAWLSAQEGAIAAGGSTISQQTVKNMYLTADQTVDRKNKEIILAYKLEKDFTKDQILTKYINHIYYGRGAYGGEAASWSWFGHSATQLSNPADPTHVAKAAFLASLIQQPGNFEQRDAAGNFVYWKELVARVHYTIDGLRELKGVPGDTLVKAEVITAAKQVPLQPLIVAQPRTSSGTSADTDPYLLAYIKEWLSAWQAEVAKETRGLSGNAASVAGKTAADTMLARGGLAIYTSISGPLQQNLRQAVDATLPRNGTSAGAVILDPRTGGMAAMYGGRDYHADPFNNALYAERSVGSTMKVVLLTDVVLNGISIKSVLPAPASVALPGQPPISNHDKVAAPGCRLTIEDAMAFSNNPVSIELITGKMPRNTSCNPVETLVEPFDSNYPVSPKSVAALARKMGADDSLVPGRTSPAKLDEVPALSLGVSSLTPLKMASIGGTLANNGLHSKPHIVTKIVNSATADTVFLHRGEQKQVIDPESAATVNQTLKSVYTKGTARTAQVSGRILAGKTGTTESDAWMLAWSPTTGKGPAYVCSVWTGYRDNRPFTASSASTARVCQQFFAQALTGPATDFPSANLDKGDRIGLK